jgi:acid phosphatase
MVRTVCITLTALLTFALGERTPVSNRMCDPPASLPKHWMLCNEGRAFRAAVADPLGRETLKVKRVVEREDGSIHDGEW